jgi:sulfofructose kinase
MTARVSCVGVAVLDLIYGVERLPTVDGKIVAHSFTESGGGMAANAAATITRLDGEAAWFGRVGDDEAGQRTLSGLAKEGVDVSHVRRVTSGRTSHSIVLVDRNGERAIVTYGSDALDSDAAWLSIDKVLRSDVVLADTRWADGAIRALAAARRAGLPAVLDGENSGSVEATRAVGAASHAIFSRPGLAGLLGVDDPEEGLRRAAKHAPFVAVTLGAEGVAWVDESGELGRLAAVPIVARETLAAGDVFHGAFALALAERRDNVSALRFATAAAAVKCGRTGGRASFPNRVEVEQCLSQMS